MGSEGRLSKKIMAALCGRFRHPAAHLAGQRKAQTNAVAELVHARYLLLVSERRDGTLVATPMRFATANYRGFLRTERDSWKVERIRDQPIVRAMGCTIRGKPQGDYVECLARIVPGALEPEAEAALRRRYGLARRLASRRVTGTYLYIELRPLAHEPPGAENEAPRAQWHSRHKARRRPQPTTVV